MSQWNRKDMKRTLKETDRVYTDPVCGMKISYKTAPAVLEYKKTKYCFCAEVCREKFVKDPNLYLFKRRK